MIAASVEIEVEAQPLEVRIPRKPIIRGSRPYRILRRLMKMGPLSYKDLSTYITGVRMLRRDKYIDPSLHSLKLRGYIRPTKDKRWTVTQEGRIAVREASDSIRTIQHRQALRLARSVKLHAEHVRLQEIMGLKPELIHGPLLDAQSPVVRD